LQVLERCKPTAPVVVFSSSENPSEVQRAIELGAKQCVQKPNNFSEFEIVVMKIVRDWVDREARRAGEVE
jgi:DNA-binding NarL/FixJ family response regulator